ncbi:MAG: hypothetical protein K6F94_02055 [Bacteroidaceae bacterium]|nr:hypothetical protein [Bacteroidaceae bacterium]
MEKTIFTFILTLLSYPLIGGEPWKGTFMNKEQQIRLVINLYEENINVPGLDMFGPMNGYVAGRGVYNVWYITKFKIIDDQHATMRISNDLGSEAQAVELTYENDSTLVFKQVDGNVMKKVVGRKLKPIPTKIELRPINIPSKSDKK